MAAWSPVNTLPDLAGLVAAKPAATFAAPAPAAAPAPFAAPLGYATPGSMTNSGVALTTRSMDMLRQTRPWARFLSIMMLIGAGLMLVGGFAMMVMGAGSSAAARRPASRRS